jgi:hypothetical protein
MRAVRERGHVEEEGLGRGVAVCLDLERGSLVDVGLGLADDEIEELGRDGAALDVETCARDSESGSCNSPRAGARNCGADGFAQQFEVSVGARQQ